mmetsp:Transcript_47837/g.126886  ORF Transcript_47837/g.126886 Transcript_47837/m.126886 type:complete len:82 (-) Transcript_47837:299-544(-)
MVQTCCPAIWTLMKAMGATENGVGEAEAVLKMDSMVKRVSLEMHWRDISEGRRSLDNESELSSDLTARRSEDFDEHFFLLS